MPYGVEISKESLENQKPNGWHQKLLKEKELL